MEDERTPEGQPDKPRKVKLAPMTEWRLPISPAAPTAPAHSAEDPSESATPFAGWRFPTRGGQNGGHPDTGAPSLTYWIVAGTACGIVLLAGVGALLWIARPSITPSDPAGTFSDSTPQERASTPTKTPAKAMIQLPNGMTIDRTSTMNYDLAMWLAENPVAARAFTLDRVAFAPGSATVEDSARGTLQGLAIILTAYPRARATISASGGADLGKARAEAIQSSLLKFATDPEQLLVGDAVAGDGPTRLTVTSAPPVRNALDS